MKSHQTWLLAAAPLLVTAMATSAIAQEAVVANSTVAAVAQVAAAPVETEMVIFPLRVSVPSSGTYIFTSPANSQMTMSLDGEVIMVVPGMTEGGAETFRVITS